MVHIEIYKINGKKYKYEVTNYRVGKKVKHRKKYICPVEPVRKRRNTYAGRKPKLRIRALTDKEKDFVKQNLRNSKSFIKDRAKIINLSAKGNTVKQICNRLSFYRPKVEKIIKQFNEKGIEIFERKKSSGRPRVMTKKERALILQYLNTHPEKLGLHFNNWSHKKLAEYANQQGIKVSPSHTGRIIKQDEIRYKRKTPWLYSDDPKFAKKNLG